MIEGFIEREIVIGMITSTDYLRRIRIEYKNRLLESDMAKRLSFWCVEHFDRYREAPGKKIESIFYEKVREGLPKDISEEIEDILQSLSEDFVQSSTDLDFLTNKTKKYFSERSITLHLEKVKGLLDSNELEEAQKEIVTFKTLPLDTDKPLLLSDRSALKIVEKAFEEASEPLIYYPKALGDFWNDYLVAGGFIALMGSEKRGKTFFLMDMALRASRQKRKVIFFQAGDMTETQQIRRFCIHLAQKSDKEKYCRKHTQPVPDCIFNQLNKCDKPERNCGFGVFEEKTEKQLREITLEELIEAKKQNFDYSPCYNCNDYSTHFWGVPWIEWVNPTDPLDVKQAKKVFRDFFVRPNRNILLSTHPNRTLSVEKIESLLNEWEISMDFFPDIIVIDYADLLVTNKKIDPRHQQNDIWSGLRKMSQTMRGGKQPLVITATLADAGSYKKGLLGLENFSEDKRKYAHVTAMFGMNQDPFGREEKIGILRLNDLVIREGERDMNKVVHILQNLHRGLPFLGSFY